MSSPKQAISDQHLPLEESFGTNLAWPVYDDIAELAYQLWEMPHAQRCRRISRKGLA